MKATAKLYFGKNKNPRRRIKVNGAENASAAISALVHLIDWSQPITRAEIVITVPRRRTKGV